jgi:hypothetical protein
MAKRSTIGKNPLDAVAYENPLDTVVPDLSMAAPAGQRQPATAAMAEVLGDMLALKTGLGALQTEMAGAKGNAAEAVRGLQAELGNLRREIDRLRADVAAAMAVGEHVAQLTDELAQIRAAASGPGDLPWWMRGKKK